MSPLTAPVLASFAREVRLLPKLAAFPSVQDKAPAENSPAAPPSPQTSTAKRVGMLGLGTVLGGVAGVGALALRGKGLRAQLAAEIKGIGKGGAKALEMQQVSKGLPQGAIDNAKAVADLLRQHGLDPKTARIGIGATGGTGKSTLARALAKEMGMTHVEGDLVGKTRFGRDLAKHFEANPLSGGSVIEQSHLLNQLNPDQFDAIIHLEKPMEQIEKQILKRGRGAAQIDFYHNPRVQRSIRHAFEHTEGPAHSVAEGVRVKVRPEGGFQADRHLNKALADQNITVSEDMSRQARLQSLASGQAVKTPGLLPYLRGRQMAILGGSGAVGGGLGYAGTSYTVANKPEDVKQASFALSLLGGGAGYAGTRALHAGEERQDALLQQLKQLTPEEATKRAKKRRRIETVAAVAGTLTGGYAPTIGRKLAKPTIEKMETKLRKGVHKAKSSMSLENRQTAKNVQDSLSTQAGNLRAKAEQLFGKGAP